MLALNDQTKKEFCKKYFKFMQNKRKIHYLIILRNDYRYEGKDVARLEAFIDRIIDETELLR